MRHRLALLLILLGFGGAMVSQGVSVARAAGPHAALVRIDDIIQPGTARYLVRAIDTAEDRAQLLIITLDTPGGLYDSTRDMVEAMLVSPVPIVVYVSPQGARAASAGTFITAAAHVAAMAPIGSIGAASPVGAGGDLPETLERKASQDAAALIRSIAEKRGRNADALEATVLEAKSYSSSEALENGLIDLIAQDIDDLMAKLHGTTVHLEGGDLVLGTAGLEIVEIERTVLEDVLSFLANPTVVFILLALGAIGIFVEFFLGAGLVLPGVAGIAFVVVAFVGMGQLSVNWAAFALIAAAMVLFYFEIAVVPGFTVFGALGAMFFAVGGLLMFGDFALPGFERQPIETPSLRVNPWVVGAIAASMFAFLVFVVREMVTARRAAAAGSTTPPRLLGQVGMVTTALDPGGTVRVDSERWSAVSDSGEPILEAEEVVVTEIEGLTLKVFKAPKGI